jgi:hypothetical protein
MSGFTKTAQLIRTYLDKKAYGESAVLGPVPNFTVGNNPLLAGMDKHKNMVTAFQQEVIPLLRNKNVPIDGRGLQNLFAAFQQKQLKRLK